MRGIGSLHIPLFITVAFALQTASAAETPALWASDCLTKVMRTAAAPASGGERLQFSGAQGEIISGQAVYRPSQTVKAASARVTALRHRGSDAVLPPDAIRLQWERYIDITRNSPYVPADELIAQAPASIPDPFWEDPTIGIAAGHAQPVWIEIQVPMDAAPGDYEGTLSVAADGASIELPLSLHVWGFQLPKERHLSVVNWWRWPGEAFEGRDEDWGLLRQFCAMLVEHRQTDVNVPIGMIGETGDATTGFSHDTSRLERFSETAFSAGIRQIHLHSIGRRTADILDPMAKVEPDAGAFRRLAAWQQVVQRRGWHRRFAASIVDEPFPYYEDSYASVVDLAHRTAPGIRCVEAVEAEHLGKLDIYVPKLSHLAMWYPHFEQVHRDGAELWFYICNHPFGRYPNRWLDQSLLKSRVLFWIHYLYDLDGYLHWGLNQYAGDPYTQEGVSKDLPLGERAIVYPGRQKLLGSLRFSVQRDGLQDFEYLRVLESRLQAIKDRLGADAAWLHPRQRPLELCRRVIWSFHDYTRDPAVLQHTRRSIAEEIEAIDQAPLLVVQTSPPEGSVVPAGPRHITVRGLVPPGASVTINDQPVKQVRPSGYFVQVYFMPDDKPTITVTAEHNGRKRTATRTFRLTD